MLLKTAKRIYLNHYRKKFCRCGTDLRFSPLNSYSTYGRIEIGNNVFINKQAYFGGMVTIGNNVMFGPYVFITDGYHKYNEPGKSAKATIMRGVHIYDGAVIGTGSMVTKDTPPYCICLGFLCKPMKLRYTDDKLREHFRILNKPKDEVERLIFKRRSMLAERGCSGTL